MLNVAFGHCSACLNFFIKLYPSHSALLIYIAFFVEISLVLVQIADILCKNTARLVNADGFVDMQRREVF